MGIIMGLAAILGGVCQIVSGAEALKGNNSKK